MKRARRIIVAKMYCKWRREGRQFCIYSRQHGYFNDVGEFCAMATTFDKIKAIKAYRYGAYANPYKITKEYIEMSRIWQIKNRVNYGRY